jgi:hypothetical protein
VSGVGELSEGEAAWAAGLAVRAETYAYAGVDVDEDASQLLLRGLVRKVPDEDRRRNGSLLSVDLERP